MDSSHQPNNFDGEGLVQPDIAEQIAILAEKYSKVLDAQIKARIVEMDKDDRSYYLIYQVLQISEKEGNLIDIYQNKGRFLYKYAGSFLEEASILCFIHGCKNVSPKRKVQNTLGTRPKEFEIDCLIDTDAIELKWRDATTDGDHITKEHTRVKVIQNAGFKPIRIMFYYPNREQAIRIQDTLKTLYRGVGGEYYSREDAWDYIKERTHIDLKAILTTIAEENAKKLAESAVIAERIIKDLTEGE